MNINVAENKARFKRLVSENISRDGIKDLMSYLEHDTDFFEAPCSTKYHLNVRGGLCEHSINVYCALMDLCTNYSYDIVKNTETLTIVSLFHDVCKTNFYKPTLISKKVNGQWVQTQGFEIDDKFPIGHGEKSVIIIQQHMRLTIEEMLAIRWHMGAWDTAVKGGEYAFSTAQACKKLVTLLHCADTIASHILEA